MAFEIADKVARQLIEPGEENTWEHTAPYATCVGLAFPVIKALRATYTAILELEAYTNKAETLVSVERDLSGVKQPFHCLVAVCLEQFSIIIDLTFSPVAFLIPVNGIFEALPYFTTSGRRSQRLFRYSIVSAGGKALTVEKTGTECFFSCFTQMDHGRALQQISITAAKKKCKELAFLTKTIIVRKLICDQPNKIPGVNLNMGLMVTASKSISGTRF